LNIKLLELEEKFVILQNECETLNKRIINLQTPEPKRNIEIYDRLLILHGLPENYWETEEEIIDRVIIFFYNLINIDLSGYIEEVTFIGRKNTRRPLKIKLISKIMKKWILNNSLYFRVTGFSVAEFLSPQAQQEKRKLNRILSLARQQGHHAIIRNNKLIIDGKEITDLPSNEKSATSTMHNKEDKDRRTPVQMMPENAGTSPISRISAASDNLGRTDSYKRKGNTARTTTFRNIF
jgi:hypothetical protein